METEVDLDPQEGQAGGGTLFFAWLLALLSGGTQLAGWCAVHSQTHTHTHVLPEDVCCCLLVKTMLFTKM